MWQGDDGNWWVKYSDINVGYYPAEIFNNFTNPGIVGEGGATVAPNPPAGICPPLGSGIFPDGKYEHSCSIRLVQYLNNTGIRDLYDHSYEKIIDSPGYYNVRDPKYRVLQGYTFCNNYLAKIK